MRAWFINAIVICAFPAFSQAGLITLHGLLKPLLGVKYVLGNYCEGGKFRTSYQMLSGL